ncbi:MAG: efflux RND transporter periplasmic adaptor subunit [Thermodesulfobacteriota bacterium]
MKHTKSFPAYVPAMLLVCFLSLACSGEEKTIPAQNSRPATTMVIRQQAALTTHTFSGKAKNSQTSQLSFRVSGLIEQLPIQVGSRVQKGQIIARLESDDYRLQVSQAQAKLEAIRSRYKEVSQDFKRMRDLLAQEVISQSRFEEAESAFKSVSANIKEAEKSLQIARRNLSYTTLKAPTSGIISRVPVEKFQNIKSGQPVATLLSGKSIEVVAGVPDKLIYSLNPGQEAKVRFNALPQKNFNATITKISMQSSALSTYPVTVALDRPGSQIRPGMSALVSFFFKPKTPESIFIPLSAVVHEPYGAKFVWVVTPETRTVQKKKVRTGTIRDKRVEILKGLSAGDEIVIRGAHRLHTNDKINPVNADRF